MTTYFVDDGGDGSDGLTWAKAYTSINALDAAVAFASGDIVYFGHDHVCQAVNSATLTIVGPTSGLPVVFISATTGSDPPAYQKGTGTQIDTTEGATFDVVFNGAFALYGIFVKAGRDIYGDNDQNESFYCRDCTLAPGPSNGINASGNNGTGRQFVNLIADLTQDGSSDRSGSVFLISGSAGYSINGLTFVNPGFRTGNIFAGAASQTGRRDISGADFSGFTNATTCEIFGGNSQNVTLTNCKTVANYSLYDASAANVDTRILATNVGSADDPAGMWYHDYFGDAKSSTSIYRSGGATIEGIANSWLVTTTAVCNEYAPFHSPWIYGLVSSTGSKTFDTYITNDTADFTNAQIWLEVEYLATSDSPLWTLASDQRATITTTAADQDDDTTSTWVGAGPAYTYKQRLRVTATVGETGQFRARVVTGVASIASSRYFHIDPLVTVT